jgi:peptidylprolyl isomerase
VAKAKMGDIAKVHYAIKLRDGKIIEDSVNRQPLRFTIGRDCPIPGLDRAVIGMSPGESKMVHLPVGAAFGPYQAQLVFQIDRARLHRGYEPRVGQRIKINRAAGLALMATITEVADTYVTLDANAPLAGQELIFDILLVDAAPSRGPRPPAPFWQYPPAGTYHPLQ